MISGNGRSKKKIATNAADGNCHVERRHQGSPRDANHGLRDDRDHGRLDAVEKGLDEGHVAEQRVDDRKHHQDDDARQDEQQACRQTAADAVHQPADVRRELLRLWAGEQHAVVQRVQKSTLADPFPALDDLAVHDRDLAGRPAEAVERDIRPRSQRLAEGYRRRAVIYFVGHVHRVSGD